MTDLVTMGWAAISWIEHYLVHGPGDVQGQPIELDDEFAAFILKAYRLDPKTGERVVRRAFLSRSKGRSKSGVAAMNTGIRSNLEKSVSTFAMPSASAAAT